VFLGAFAAGAKIEVRNGRLKIVREGKCKLVREVEQITFSGEVSARSGQEAMYITERAVFQLTALGLELVEIAPGIDLERDILAQMEFRPIIRHKPKLMDSRIFLSGPMDLAGDFLPASQQEPPEEKRITLAGGV